MSVAKPDEVDMYIQVLGAITEIRDERLLDPLQPDEDQVTIEIVVNRREDGWLGRDWKVRR